jgi:hypothetical protein
LSRIGRSISLGLAAVALAVGSLTTPAAAVGSQAETFDEKGSDKVQVATHTRGDGTKPPAELGNPSEWGVVTMKMDTSSPRLMSEACVDVASGGTWCYGWYTTTVDGIPQKYCYSNYLHYSKDHASTVKLAGGTDRDTAGPGDVSQANLTAGYAYTCKAYYSTS